MTEEVTKWKFFQSFSNDVRLYARSSNRNDRNDRLNKIDPQKVVWRMQNFTFPTVTGPGDFFLGWFFSEDNFNHFSVLPRASNHIKSLIIWRRIKWDIAILKQQTYVLWEVDFFGRPFRPFHWFASSWKHIHHLKENWIKFHFLLISSFWLHYIARNCDLTDFKVGSIFWAARCGCIYKNSSLKRWMQLQRDLNYQRSHMKCCNHKTINLGSISSG
jgi:hypothetical protein